MFGYVRVNDNELKIKDFKIYRAYYCGLCRELRQRMHAPGRLTLTYDMTFLAMLLDGLYDLNRKKGKELCPVHPLKKHPFITSEAVSYAADMNLLLTYGNLLDKWHDSKDVAAKAGSTALKKTVQKIGKQYPKQYKAVKEYMKKLHETEDSESHEIEAAAALTGEMLGTIFTWRDDMWKDTLYSLGFALGRFIYYADAYCDMEEDEKKHNYNIFNIYKKDEPTADIDAHVKEILTITAADAAKNFEKLPIVDNAEILKNIIYSGIWSKVLNNKKAEKTDD